MRLGTSWAKAMLELEPALSHEDTGTKFSLDSRQVSKGQGDSILRGWKYGKIQESNKKGITDVLNQYINELINRICTEKILSYI